MTPRAELTPPSDYARELRALLPPGAFAASPRRLLPLAAHLLVVVAGYLGCRYASSAGVYLLLALVIGHSLACVGLLAHDLSHNCILRPGPLRYLLEVPVWAINLVPATVWHRVHNQTHHVHTNTPDDPDRPFLLSERSWPVRLYARLLYPHRRTLRWNPLVAFHFVPYIVRNIAAAFYPGAGKPDVVPFKPAYTPGQRVRVVFELAVIVALQLGIFLAVGSRWEAYLWASPAAVLVTSAVIMGYIFTNHFTNPLGEITDPLAATTSVVVPPVLDRLHSNFSYHTEHHLFPQMNPHYYPEVSRLLREKYPARYHRVPILVAWRALWTGEEFVPDKRPTADNPPPSA
jgi:fatty acid desaturase